MKIKDIDFEKYEIFSDGKIWSKMFNRYKKTQKENQKHLVDIYGNINKIKKRNILIFPFKIMIFLEYIRHILTNSLLFYKH